MQNQGFSDVEAIVILDGLTEKRTDQCFVFTLLLLASFCQSESDNEKNDPGISHLTAKRSHDNAHRKAIAGQRF
jgi:hypothetical protein